MKHFTHHLGLLVIAICAASVCASHAQTAAPAETTEAALKGEIDKRSTGIEDMGNRAVQAHETGMIMPRMVGHDGGKEATMPKLATPVPRGTDQAGTSPKAAVALPTAPATAPSMAPVPKSTSKVTPLKAPSANDLKLPAIFETQYQTTRRDPFISIDAPDTIVRNDKAPEPPTFEDINSLALLILDNLQKNFTTQGISISENSRYALINNRHVAEGDYLALAMDPDVVQRIFNTVQNNGETIHFRPDNQRIYLMVKEISEDAIHLALPSYSDTLPITFHKNYGVQKEAEDEPDIVKEADLPSTEKGFTSGPKVKKKDIKAKPKKTGLAPPPEAPNNGMFTKGPFRQ